MAFITPTDPNQGDATKLSWAKTVDADLIYLSTLTGGTPTFVNGCPQLANPSFENNSGGQPSSWTFNQFSGGSGAVDNTTTANGTYALKITCPGGGATGGGYYETNDFYPITGGQVYSLRFMTESSTATLQNEVDIRWYDINQSFLSASAVWSDSSANPASFAMRSGNATAPSNARFCKVRVIGSQVGSPAGSTWFDAVEFFINCIQAQGMNGYTGGGTFNVPAGVTKVEYLVVGAGGGGGTYNPGSGPRVSGGGGGGASTGFLNTIPGGSISVSVGGGGSGATGGSGGNGGNSSITHNGTTVTANGGGGGSQGGATGGTASGGQVNLTGQNGLTVGNTVVSSTGVGGQGALGGAYGCGGSVASDGNHLTASNGMGGLVIIKY